MNEEQKKRHNQANKKWRDSNREKHLQYFRKYNKTPKRKFDKYKYRSRCKNREFSLTYEQFKLLINGTCYYCGESENIGIDRKNNRIGYTFENSVSCCWSCNKIKGSATSKEFLSVCDRVSKFRAQR